MEESSKNNIYAIPAAILVAGLLIAGAVFYSNRGGELASNIGQQQSKKLDSDAGTENNVRQVGADDHILGNPAAPVKLIEFSDLECPFCRRFHPTMMKVMDEYGKSGKVAWVYRHFPLDRIHSKARKEAQAAECANELGGNPKFWEYVNKVFEATPSNDNLDLSLLPQIAQNIGLDRARFELCLDGDMKGGKYAGHIERDYQDAIASGGTGTPYSIVIARNGKKFTINGAQPYSAVKSVIELALKE